MNPKQVNDVVDATILEEWNPSLGSRLKIQVEDMSNLLVKVMPNPNKNIVEDRTWLEKPEVKDLALVAARVSSLTRFLTEIDQFERPFFFHKYPRLSKTYMVLLMVFASLSGEWGG